jgi:hypothetical protein
MSMKNSPPIYRYQLRVLAGKLLAGAMTQGEKMGLAKLLRMLGDGLSVEEILGVKKPAHRPQGRGLEQRVFDVARLQLPKKHGGEGLGRNAAITEVAGLFNKEFDSVLDEYKSDRGKKIRAIVKADHYNPLEDDMPH